MFSFVMDKYRKMTKQILKHIIRISAICIISVVLIQLNSSCENKDCQGCYKDAPYSAPGETICYPDKDMCTDELGVECQRCI
jgi:hypothetical protein